MLSLRDVYPDRMRHHGAACKATKFIKRGFGVYIRIIMNVCMCVGVVVCVRGSMCVTWNLLNKCKVGRIVGSLFFVVPLSERHFDNDFAYIFTRVYLVGIVYTRRIVPARCPPRRGSISDQRLALKAHYIFYTYPNIFKSIYKPMFGMRYRIERYILSTKSGSRCDLK